MTLAELWMIFRARRRLFFVTLGGILVLTLLVGLLIPSTYIAQASLVIDTKGTDPVTGNALPEELAATVLATQTDIIESHNVALKVVDRLKLADDPHYIRQYKSATDGEVAIRDWLADRLARQVIVRPSRESNVLNVEFPAHDRQTAALLTNAFADAYIQTSLELKADPARRQSAWFDQEIIGLRQRVDAAQKHLADEQRRTSIVGTGSHLDVDNARLSEISSQLVAAQQALYESRTRLQQMNTAIAKHQLSDVPDVLGNPLLQTLKTDLARAEADFANVASRYDRRHPQYLSAQANVDSLRRKLASEVDAVRGSVAQSAQISQRQVDELQHALDQQKAALIGSQRQHDALDVFKNEVDSAQRAYDAGLQRATQVRLASQVDQTGVAILNPALPPLQRARPRMLLYMLIALVFGSLLGAGACVAAELMDPRVRSSSNITTGSRLPVLAEVPDLLVRRSDTPLLTKMRSA